MNGASDGELDLLNMACEAADKLMWATTGMALVSGNRSVYSLCELSRSLYDYLCDRFEAMGGHVDRLDLERLRGGDAE